MDGSFGKESTIDVEWKGLRGYTEPVQFNCCEDIIKSVYLSIHTNVYICICVHICVMCVCNMDRYPGPVPESTVEAQDGAKSPFQGTCKVYGFYF